MKDGYDHHDHQDIYTNNLSVLKRLTLDVPNQSPPFSLSCYVVLQSGCIHVDFRDEDLVSREREIDRA